MALDQALEPSPPVLRLYAFDPPGLSLGYFQRAAEFPQAELDRLGLVLVRRVTGGRAICHRDDLTFALAALPRDPLFAGTVEDSYHRLHAAVARGLARLGVRAEPRAGGAARSDSGRGGEPVCFYQATAFDLVAAGRKLVGSAQRRWRDRILHHGSIPIRKNQLAPAAACLEDLLGRAPPFSEVAAAVAAGFGEVLGLELQPSAPSDEELRRAHDLVRRRFGTDAWNRRR